MKKIIYPYTFEWNVRPGLSTDPDDVYVTDMEPDGNKVAVGKPVTIDVELFNTTTLMLGKLACLEAARDAIRKEFTEQLTHMEMRIDELKALPAPEELKLTGEVFVDANVLANGYQEEDRGKMSPDEYTDDVTS